MRDDSAHQSVKRGLEWAWSTRDLCNKVFCRLILFGGNNVALETAILESGCCRTYNRKDVQVKVLLRLKICGRLIVFGGSLSALLPLKHARCLRTYLLIFFGQRFFELLDLGNGSIFFVLDDFEMDILLFKCRLDLPGLLSSLLQLVLSLFGLFRLE